MKRGKDDEKVMGPMFPRLHVNDTEKGGPRAPPRNKMALYEQLSIPSQRFKTGLVPINQNNTANGIPSASSSQGSEQQRGIFYSHQLAPLRQVAEKPTNSYFGTSAPVMPLEQDKRLEEDDFRVPIFTQSNMGQDYGKVCSNVDREKLFPSSPAYAEHSTKHLMDDDMNPRQVVAVQPNTRQGGGNQNEENLKEFVGGREQSTKSASISSSTNKAAVALRQTETCLQQELRDDTANNHFSLMNAEHHSLPEHRTKSHPKSRVLGDAVFDEPPRSTNNRSCSVTMSDSDSDSDSEEERTIDDTESHEDKTWRSLSTGIVAGDDDASETSMVDSISGLEMSPDDVVGIIGQKHFWKARRAIFSQQRVFAVQVFELHRLIKVQRLIAGSPHLLFEDSAYLSKPIKGSSPKKLPLDYIVKAIPTSAKQKNDSKKPNHKIERSAENTVGKASLSSVQNGSQLPSYRPLSVNSPATAASSDHTMGSWCFHQPQGHQWLIPVMSPSDGLVYKPYPWPGFMAPPCGGCGPPGSIPMMGNFLTPSYGIPGSYHYQGMGVPPFAAPAGPQGYVPPYGMAVLNQGTTGSAGDQMNCFAAYGVHSQLPRLAAKHNIQHQKPSNVPSQKTGAVPDVMQLHASKDSELQISTASSPSEKVQVRGRGKTTEQSDVLPLFPTSPVVEAPSSHTQSQEIDHPARVIKVVPRNGRLASESVAARVIKVVPRDGRVASESVACIFQSILDERKQYDSV